MRSAARMVARLALHGPVKRVRVARGWAGLVPVLCVVRAISMPAHGETVYALRAHAAVASDAVRLEDIVEAPAGVAQHGSASSATVLWRAPAACRPMTASAADVQARLRRAQPSSSEGVTLTGATEVTIESGCQRVDRGRLVAIATDALDAWLRVRSHHVELAAHGSVEVVELPPGPVTLTARPVAPGQALASRMQVWIDVAVAGRFVRSVPLVFEVRAYRDAWLATRDIRAGRSLGEADLVRREIDVAASAGEPVRAIPDNVRLRRTLLAGEVLTASHVEPRPQVSRGSIVTVVSRAGAFAVQARAEALQDGRVGQPVWVRVAASTGPVLARVVDEATVELGHD